MKRSSSDDSIGPANKAKKTRKLRGEKETMDLKPAAKSPEGAGKITEKMSHRLGGTDIAAEGVVPEKAKRFPDRLLELLNTDAAPASLYWLPGGRAFAIEQESFDTKVLDKYFQATKFASFVRRLHKWGFRRETRGFRKEIGPDLSRSVIAFSHTLFQKENPQLALQMVEVSKKQQTSSVTAAPSPSRKRDSSGESQTSPTPRQRTAAASPASFAGHSSTFMTERAMARPAQLRGVPEGLEAAFPSESAMQRSLLGSSLQQQLLLQNLRSNVLQNQDRDHSYELLLRNQHQNDSILQHSMITASLAQQQQQQLHHHRVALAAAAASNNHSLFGVATARERIQMNSTNASLPQVPFSNRAPSLMGQLDSARLSQPAAENNSQLMETMFLLELQRQQQQQLLLQQDHRKDQQPPGGGGNR